ncbi:MAG TPA: Rrf2 family transcriptional regulator [Melioribacteraceae bacterium]|nr:Rrf2 family transcriptional regulator [Melioribacteraceae bacterium]
MQITLACEYAIRAMLFLANQPNDKLIPTKDIAEFGDIPKPFLQKILNKLTKSNLINSIRGINGGVRLSKDANDICLLEIIEAIEGKIFFNQCFFEPDFCHRTNWCAVHTVWSEAQNMVRSHLKSKSLKYLVDINNKNSCKVINL